MKRASNLTTLEVKQDNNKVWGQNGKLSEMLYEKKVKMGWDVN